MTQYPVIFRIIFFIRQSHDPQNAGHTPWSATKNGSKEQGLNIFPGWSCKLRCKCRQYCYNFRCQRRYSLYVFANKRITSLLTLTTPITELGQVHMKESYVYILASKYNGTLYIGLTTDLIKRIWEHKNKFVPGFTNKYNVTMLVYYEIFNDIRLAAAREKRLKEWKRQWKIDLIQKMNPDWQDLYRNIIQ